MTLVLTVWYSTISGMITTGFKQCFCSVRLFRDKELSTDLSSVYIFSDLQPPRYISRQVLCTVIFHKRSLGDVSK